jgi:hypothetical protein
LELENKKSQNLGVIIIKQHVSTREALTKKMAKVNIMKATIAKF